MYLTYRKYKEYGGVVEEKNYAFFECLARKKLNYWTFNKIKEVTEDIELCMFLIIEQIYKIETGEADVSSVSNDGISMSFVDAKTSEQKLQDLYRKIVEILPVELVSVALCE